MFKFLKKKKYNHFFVYKWGILAGIVETLLILFSAFVITSLQDLFRSNSEALLVFNTFYLIIAVIFTFFIVFGMPLYLAFKKKMVSTALLVLLMSIATLFVFFTILLLTIVII
jgi:hypothetical protein